jgi:hypothetical protein
MAEVKISSVGKFTTSAVMLKDGPTCTVSVSLGEPGQSITFSPTDVEDLQYAIKMAARMASEAAVEAFHMQMDGRTSAAGSH